MKNCAHLEHDHSAPDEEQGSAHESRNRIQPEQPGQAKPRCDQEGPADLLGHILQDCLEQIHIRTSLSVEDLTHPGWENRVYIFSTIVIICQDYVPLL